MDSDPILYLILVGIPLSALAGAVFGFLRGRILAGVVFSLFLGPLGWLIVYLGPDLRPKCPFCRGVVVESAVACKNRGRALRLSPEEQRKRDRELLRQMDPVSRWEREQRILGGEENGESRSAGGTRS
jgi:hypothetical protein